VSKSLNLVLPFLLNLDMPSCVLAWLHLALLTRIYCICWRGEQREVFIEDYSELTRLKRPWLCSWYRRRPLWLVYCNRFIANLTCLNRPCQMCPSFQSCFVSSRGGPRRISLALLLCGVHSYSNSRHTFFHLCDPSRQCTRPSWPPVCGVTLTMTSDDSWRLVSFLCVA